MIISEYDSGKFTELLKEIQGFKSKFEKSNIYLKVRKGHWVKNSNKVINVELERLSP